MASGVASPPQCILHTSASRWGAAQAKGDAAVCRVIKHGASLLGYNNSYFFRSLLSRSIPSAHQWHHHSRRRWVVHGATDGSKSGFGPQPVKKNKKSDRPRPKKETDPITQAQQILAEKQQGNEASTSTAASERAPALGLEALEEKAVVAGDSEKHFEERLAEIKRQAAEVKTREEQQKYLPIDYDALPPAAAADAKWTDSVAARIGIGVAVLVFGAIFALGDFLPSGRAGYLTACVHRLFTFCSPNGDSSTQVEQKHLPPEEAAKLKAQVEKFEETLKSSPEDRDALEGAGVTYAELGEYSKSAAYLTKLVQKVPNDAEAQRLLGEVRYEAGDYAGSATAYRSAIRASPKESVGLLQGLSAALLADNKPSEAVGELLAARARLNRPEASGSTSAGPAPTEEPFDPVQVEMLLGKAYASWQGHSGDAVAVYDALIAARPDDFRGYLAKGILLKDQGRAGDAERMFIQARYLAPPRAKGLVDRYSGR